MDIDAARRHVEATWEESILPALEHYIEIPAKSPAFDSRWHENGHLRRAVEHVAEWCREQPAELLGDLSVAVCERPGRTPLLLLEAPAFGVEGEDDPVVLYGHLDKQPEMTGWSEGLGPWRAVRRGDRLYGRGGADDGYAAFASLTAIAALRAQGVAHRRCVALIECSEESGSMDLPEHVDALADRIGNPSLVVCLDSGCGTYDRLWHTTSLRGLAGGTLTIDVLAEGVHSGDAGGVVPETFRVLRALLDRIEDSATGEVLLDSARVAIDDARHEQARLAAEAIGDQLWQRFPFVGSTRPQRDPSKDAAEIVLDRTWRASLAVVGADGLPPIADAGNVLRPHLAVKLSLRVPPSADADAVSTEMKRVLESDPPHGARVRFDADWAASGWVAPDLEPWIEESLAEASRAVFDRDLAFMGEGGTIPFMGMLGEKFPEAQFVVTGVLGPESNAHGPNEFLHVPMGKNLTTCVAKVLADHVRRPRR